MDMWPSLSMLHTSGSAGAATATAMAGKDGNLLVKAAACANTLKSAVSLAMPPLVTLPPPPPSAAPALTSSCKPTLCIHRGLANVEVLVHYDGAAHLRRAQCAACGASAADAGLMSAGPG